MIAQSLTLTASRHGKDRLVNLPPLDIERQIEREMDETIRRSLAGGQSVTLSAPVDLAPSNEEDGRVRGRDRGASMTPQQVEAEMNAQIDRWFAAAERPDAWGRAADRKNQKQKASPDLLLSGHAGQRAKAEADAAALFAAAARTMQQHQINH